MNEPGVFRVVLTGRYVGDAEPVRAWEQLAALTGGSAETIARLLERAPVVVKRGLDEEAAHRYRRAIEGAGVECRLEGEVHEAAGYRVCPKCGTSQPEQRIDCSACGIVFHKYRPAPSPEVADEPEEFGEEPEKYIRSVANEGWWTLGIGMAGAVAVLMLPFINTVLSAFSTLVHEFGHSLTAWSFGYPSLPAFDFVYGGGVAVHFERKAPLLWLVYGLFIWALFHYRQRLSTLVVLLAAMGIYSLVAFTPAHRVFGLFMGHGMELVFASLFLFRALSGHATFHGLERAAYGFMGFVLQFRALQFVYDFFTDPAFREFYRQGKGGLTNDFHRIAMMLNVELAGVFGFFLACALLPPLLAWLAYRYERFWFPTLQRLFGR